MVPPKNILRLKHHSGKSDNFLVNSGETSVWGGVWEHIDILAWVLEIPAGDWNDQCNPGLGGILPSMEILSLSAELVREGGNACQVCHINRNADVTARPPSNSLPSWKNMHRGLKSLKFKHLLWWLYIIYSSVYYQSAIWQPSDVMIGSIVLSLEKSCVTPPGFAMIEALEQILEFSVVDLST